MWCVNVAEQARSVKKRWKIIPKKNILFVSILLPILLCSSAFAKAFSVAIFDYDTRPANEKTVARHIENCLRKTGLQFATIQHFTAGENIKHAMDVLANLEKSEFDLIITISSDAMAPAVHTVRNTPLLFTNVNNPKLFGIRNPLKPGRNISGVTYYVPIKRQLQLFNRIMNGGLKKMGLIFDRYSKSRRAELGEFRFIANQMGISHDVIMVDTAGELPAAATKLIKQDVDAIVLASSDLIYENTQLILRQCTDNRIPIFSVNKKGVAKGAIAAYASDYFRMVDECLIPMAVAVLRDGKNPGEMPVRYLDTPSVYLNVTQARKIGLTIPVDIIQAAFKVY